MAVSSTSAFSGPAHKGRIALGDTSFVVTGALRRLTLRGESLRLQRHHAFVQIGDGGGVFTMTSADLPTLNRSIDQSTLAFWRVTVDFQEVARSRDRLNAH